MTFALFKSQYNGGRGAFLILVITYYIPGTVLDMFELFQESNAAQSNPKLIGNLKTTLRKYVLPGYGFSPAQLKREADLLAALKELRVRDFKNPEAHLLTMAAENQVSAGTLANYRSALNRFNRWAQDQAWYHDAFGTYDGKLTPRMCVGYNLGQQGGASDDSSRPIPMG